ncbi:MAG: hypothetical protein ACOCP8_01270 [archaeon]
MWFLILILILFIIFVISTYTVYLINLKRDYDELHFQRFTNDLFNVIIFTIGVTILVVISVNLLTPNKPNIDLYHELQNHFKRNYTIINDYPIDDVNTFGKERYIIIEKDNVYFAIKLYRDKIENIMLYNDLTKEELSAILEYNNSLH